MAKRNVLIISVSILLIPVVVLIILGRRGDFRSCAERGRNLVEALQAGEYEGAKRDFAPLLSQTFASERMGRAWSDALEKCGQLKGYAVTYDEALGDPDDSRLVCLTCDFERGRKWLVLAFDGARQIRIFALCDTPEENQSVMNQVRQQARGRTQPR